MHPLYECEIYGTCCSVPSKHVLSEKDRLEPINLARWNPSQPLETLTPQSCQICPLHSNNRQTLANVTLVIIFHNYGKYLLEVIESVQQQTFLPSEVLLIDSGSTDDTLSRLEKFAANPTHFGYYMGDPNPNPSGLQAVAKARRKMLSKYRVLRNPSGNLWDARKLGYDESSPTTDYILFLDADDLLSPEYVRTSLEIMSEVPECAVVRPDHQLFGDETRRDTYGYHDNYMRDADLYRWNTIPGSGSMVRKAAIEDTLPFDGILPNEIDSTKIGEDWLLFKRILKHGWKLVRNSAPVLYRKHGKSLLTEVAKSPYPVRASIAYDPLTIVIPFSGREYGKDALDWLLKQPHTRDTHLILLDCRAVKPPASSDSLFDNTTLTSLRDRYDSLQIVKVHLPDSNTESDREMSSAVHMQYRMTRIYNHLHGRLNHTTTPLTLIIEDDIRPPLHAIPTLISKFAQDVDAVAGVYPSRWEPKKWHAEFIPGHALTSEDLRDERPTYDAPYGLAGVGCALMRTSILTDNSQPFRSNVALDPGSGWFDVHLWQSARARRPNQRHLVTWEVECGHAQVKASWETPTTE